MLRVGRAPIISAAARLGYPPIASAPAHNPRSGGSQAFAGGIEAGGGAGGAWPAVVAVPPLFLAASAMPMRAEPPNTRSMPARRPIAQAAVDGKPVQMRTAST